MKSAPVLLGGEFQGVISLHMGYALPIARQLRLS